MRLLRMMPIPSANGFDVRRTSAGGKDVPLREMEISNVEMDELGPSFKIRLRQRIVARKRWRRSEWHFDSIRKWCPLMSWVSARHISQTHR
jgi:hypothetical protein